MQAWTRGLVCQLTLFKLGALVYLLAWFSLSSRALILKLSALVYLLAWFSLVNYYLILKLSALVYFLFELTTGRTAENLHMLHMQ